MRTIFSFIKWMFCRCSYTYIGMAGFEKKVYPIHIYKCDKCGNIKKIYFTGGNR